VAAYIYDIYTWLFLSRLYCTLALSFAKWRLMMVMVVVVVVVSDGP